MLCEFNNMTFWKRQNQRVGKKISGFQGLMGAGIWEEGYKGE